jgi:hypothetical protein
MAKGIMVATHSFGNQFSVELCHEDPSVPHNENPYYLTHGDIFYSEASSDACLTIPSHNFAPVSKDTCDTVYYSGP